MVCLGPKHHDTLGTVQGLASVYSIQGRYEEGERLYQRALQGNEEKLGLKHPDTLGIVEGLACVYRDQSRYEEAERLYQRALQGREEKLGPILWGRSKAWRQGREEEAGLHRSEALSLEGTSTLSSYVSYSFVTNSFNNKLHANHLT
jgi:tetratricopeptide (TPR) repeat protein